jgi:hypothetical protein
LNPKNSIFEEVLTFGESNSLVGILSRPQQLNPTKPAIVILNSGVLHRTGACRVAVTLARYMAELGYPVFRFDFYGIGDSGFGTSENIGELSGRIEVTLALNLLEQALGVNSFVLHGLCSGARDGFCAALDDPRVIAVSQIDSYSYQNSRFYIKRLITFLKKPSTWLNAIKIRTFARNNNNQTSETNINMVAQAWPEYPPRQEVEKAYQTLVNRRTKLLMVYTGSWNDTYNYEHQFFDLFSAVQFGNLVTLKYMPKANHVMTEENDRSDFIKTFKQFVQHL